MEEEMQISRDADGLRFIGMCDPQTGFVAGDIHCVPCGRRIDPHATERDITLTCSGCGFKKTFWAEADLQVYLAEHWGHLRKACTHPTVMTLRR
jgi:hypothetical protein